MVRDVHPSGSWFFFSSESQIQGWKKKKKKTKPRIRNTACVYRKRDLREQVNAYTDVYKIILYGTLYALL